MTPAYLSDRALSEYLGLSLYTFRKKRPIFERQGFPPRDGLVGLTLTADVEAWLARRRVVADRVAAVRIEDGSPQEENLDAF